MTVYYKTDDENCYYSNTQQTGYYEWSSPTIFERNPSNGKIVIIELTDDKFVLPENSACLFFGSLNETFNDMNKGDTSNSINFTYMFINCKNLKEVDLSSFDTSNVVSIDRLFQGCTALTKLNMDTFNMTNVRAGGCNMYCVVNGCTSLTEISLMNLDVSKAEKIDGMFCGCENLEHIYAPEGTNGETQLTPGATSKQLFENCFKLSNWDGTIDITKANTTETGYFTPVKVGNKYIVYMRV